MSEVKILYLIDEMEALSAGGTERQVLQIISSLAGTGLLPYLCVFRGTRWLSPEMAGCPVHYENIRKLASPAGVAALLRLTRWMKRERFQIVQTFFVEANLLGPLLARLAGVPIVLGSRRNLNHWMGPPMHFAQRVADRLVTRFMANSELVKRRVTEKEGIDSRKVDVIYSGVDTEKFAPDPTRRVRMRAQLGVNPDEILVGNVSRLTPIKGLDGFLKAASLVRKQSSKTKFLLVGDGPMRPQLENMVQQLDLSDYFLFAGAQDDVVPFLQACDIAVLSSHSEGLSNSLLEYMSVGLACLATDVGGNAETLGSAAGVLVPPGCPRSLAEAMLVLIENAGRRSTLGVAARARAVELFGLLEARKKLVRYYEEILESQGKRVAPSPKCTQQLTSELHRSPTMTGEKPT